MRLLKEDLYILKLKGRAPANYRLGWLHEMSDEECLRELRLLTGQDFGKDVKAWSKWWTKEKRRRGLTLR